MTVRPEAEASSARLGDPRQEQCGGTASLELDELSGVIERITYHNPKNGFSVLRVRVPDHRGRIAVIGHVAAPTTGESITASGKWVMDRTRGLQFQAVHLCTTSSSEAADIESCLGSGMIRGIGPLHAKRLIEAFGSDVFDIIERTPQRLREVPGIGAARARRIAECWADQKAVHNVMLFLHSHGIGSSRAVRIFKSYGTRAVEMIRANPYRLAQDIPGFGFAAADALAQRLGIQPDASIRLNAGIAHLLSKAANEGHCGLAGAVLLRRAERLLQVPRARIEQGLVAASLAEDVVCDMSDGEESVFPARLYEAERSIADHLRRLMRSPLPWQPIDLTDTVRRIEGKIGIALSDSQRQAIGMALASKVSVITGGPGVGKTMLIDGAVGILRERGVRIRLTALTGRAAKYLSERTGHDATTLHRLLEMEPVQGCFRRTAANPLDCDLVVVDEMSMMDVPLMAALLQALPDNAAVLLVGDVDQLPPIGPGQVLADVIASAAVPTTRVQEIFRQAAGSRIIVNAHRIHHGLMPEPTPVGAVSDFYFVDARDVPDAAGKIVAMVGSRISRRFGFDPVRDIQVLCPMADGGLGTRALNLALQETLNGALAPQVRRFGWTFRTGDKVMQMENDYEQDIYNGDLGTIVHVDPEKRWILVDFAGRDIAYDFEDLDRLTLAYATTIHKAQGSDFPAVVVPVTAQHGNMLNRNLIYTAVTRGRDLVVLVGERAALAEAIGRQLQRRRSKLKDWLADDGGLSVAREPAILGI